jgi:crotonobetainyl-CoA:carnitine CoA-transferase CaiB-like acyl-CoA transferase
LPSSRPSSAKARICARYALEQGIGRARPGSRLAGELGADTAEVRNSLGYDREATADLRKREII